MGFLPAWFVFKMPAKGDSEIKNKKSLIEKAQDTWDYLRICCYNPENGTCLTRTPFNWLKISLFTILYYAVLFTTTFIFFTLFLQIKYQDDSKPVEVAPDNIWPTLLEHPDLAIKLTNDACTPCLDITINKLFNWKPEVYSSNDMPPRVKAMLTKIGVTPDFSKEMVYVTCSERADEQKTCLDGMKIKGNMTGFLASNFPQKTAIHPQHVRARQQSHWSVELGPRISSTQLQMFCHIEEFLREKGALNFPLIMGR